jgi:hypothetical protein
MLYYIVKNLIYFAAAAITCYGMWRVLKGSIIMLNENIALDRRIKQRKNERKIKNMDIESKPSVFDRLTRDLNYMLQNTQSNYRKDTSLQTFFIFNGALFGITAILIVGISGSYSFGFYLGLFVVLANFFRLRIKLRHIRLEGGYKLTEITGEIATKYNSSINPNMKNVLIDVHRNNEDFKKHFAEIIRIDQNYVSEDQLKESIDSFVYSINTSFARELGATIFKALTTKENVGDTLIRIDVKIHQNVKDIQEETASKFDIRSLSWFHIVAFPTTFIVLTVFVKFTEMSLFHYQFQTSTGRLMFGLSIAAIGIARLTAAWYVRQPNDY